VPPQGGSFRREWDEDSTHGGKPRTVRYEFDECQGRFSEGRVVRLNGAYSRSFEPVAEEDHVSLDIDVTGWLIDANGQETPIRLHGTQNNERPQEGELSVKPRSLSSMWVTPIRRWSRFARL